MVRVGSLHELHKTSSLMLGTLHRVGVLDFVVTGLCSREGKCLSMCCDWLRGRGPLSIDC
jgi:hypothetical protein